MLKPLTLEVVGHLLTAPRSCAACALVLGEAGLRDPSTREELAAYPAELREELAKLADWLAELGRLYRHRIRIRMIDAQSPLGLYKSLLHRIRRYPTFIIEKRDVYCGWDRGRIEALIDVHLRAAAANRD